MTRPVRRGDPRRSLRGVGAGILVLESLTVGFSVLAVFSLGHVHRGVGAPRLALLGAIALGLLACGLLMRRSWGRPLGTGLQVAVVAGGFWVWPLLVVAVMFAPLWALYLRMWRGLPPETTPVG